MALRPVYSIQIMALSPALPLNTVVVPTGSRIILRDVDAYERSGVAPTTAVILNAAGGFLAGFSRTTAGANALWQWTGREVYNEGQSIVFQVISGTWDVQMSGYELSLT